MKRIFWGVMVISLISLTFILLYPDSVETYGDDIPIYPGAKIINDTENEVVFYLESLSLSRFKDFYSSGMADFGWDLSKQQGPALFFSRDNREVIIVMGVFRPEEDIPMGNQEDITAHIVNPFVSNNTPMTITILFEGG